MKGLLPFRRAWLRLAPGLLCCLPLLAFAAGPGYDVAPVPSWVREQPIAATAPAATATAAMEGLLSDHQIRLGESPVSYLRYVRRPLTAAGVTQASAISIDFNPSFQTLHLHRVAISRAGVVRDLTATMAVRLVQREQELEQGIQDGRVTALISPEDVQVGDLVDVSYSIVGANPIFAGRSFGFLPLGSPYPVDDLQLRLLSAPGHPLKLRFHAAPLPVIRKTVGDRTEYSLRLRRLKALELESGAPAWRNGMNWLEYSDYASWRDVVAWGAGLYAVPDATGPAFEAVYAGLAAEASDNADFVARALRYTQEGIRYLGLEFGEGSHRPNAPELVIGRKFGDCKDKSLLLAQLLRRHGIKAVPALVATGFRDGVAATLPGPGLFDHVITLVELDGVRYWLDGTRLYQRGRLDRIARADYGYALVLEAGESGPVRMYPDLPVEVSAAVEEHYFASDFSGPVRFVVSTRFHGNAAEWNRYQVSNVSTDVLQGKLLDYYARYHEGIEVAAPLEVSDDAVANVVTITETYRIPDFWRRQQGAMSHPVLLLAFQGVLEKPREVNRKTPLLLSPPRYISSRTYVHYPTSVMMTLDPTPGVVDGGGFRYVYKDRHDGNVYFHQAELSILKPLIEADEVPRFLSGLRKLHENMDFRLTFRDPDAAGLPEIGQLKELYRDKGRVK